MATYAALRLHVDSWRWEGVPFYVCGGKSLAMTCTEVMAELRNPSQDVFREPAPSRSGSPHRPIGGWNTPIP
jgi:glucose-6-phosphate 1-dehydrogenase